MVKMFTIGYVCRALYTNTRVQIEKVKGAPLFQFSDKQKTVERVQATKRRPETIHTHNMQHASANTIDYRATYVYGIGNGRAPPIVLHWAALKHSPEYLALAKIN